MVKNFETKTMVYLILIPNSDHYDIFSVLIFSSFFTKTLDFKMKIQ